MKIYQLHEYGGEWEYSFDNIIGSYFLKIRAEEEKVKAEARDRADKELSRHCINCPLVDGYGFDDKVVKQCEEYCDRFKRIDMGDDGFDCGNYTTHWDDVYFRIEEVEVE